MRALQIAPFLTNKANFQNSQMNVNKEITTNYEQLDTWSIGKNKAKTNPIQTQFKANTNPIQSQFKPKQTQFQSQNNAALGLLELYAMGFRTDIIMLFRSLSGKCRLKVILEIHPVIW
jgi:hypothetical protein